LQIPTYHPGQRQADELIKVFFDSVHPFTGIPNKKSFFGDLEKFRMGKLAQPPIFEALLYSIYGLALSSLPSNAVLGMFSMPKKRSLDRFQDAQELALRRLNLLESNDISVFQVFLLYLVRDRSQSCPIYIYAFRPQPVSNHEWLSKLMLLRL
jgi:hypothetical protein